MDGAPPGVLDPRQGEQKYEEWLQPAPADLDHLIGRCWGASWDLRGREPYTQHILAEPCVNLVVEPHRSAIHGPTTGRFSYVFDGRGWIFGISFRPASFRQFLGSSVSAITDRVVGIRDVFGTDGGRLVDEVRRSADHRARTDLAERFLRERVALPDPNITQVNGIVSTIRTDRRILRVDDLVDPTGLGVRALQRLFREYVGVSPKRVIQRFRLREAADRLAVDQEVDLAALALELGYFDQAHFIRDFGAFVGRPPGAYGACQAARRRSTSPRPAKTPRMVTPSRTAEPTRTASG